jgi:hypothetical protein
MTGRRICAILCKPPGAGSGASPKDELPTILLFLPPDGRPISPLLRLINRVWCSREVTQADVVQLFFFSQFRPTMGRRALPSSPAHGTGRCSSLLRAGVVRSAPWKFRLSGETFTSVRAYYR